MSKRKAEDAKVALLLELFEKRTLTIDKIQEVMGDKPVVWVKP